MPENRPPSSGNFSAWSKIACLWILLLCSSLPHASSLFVAANHTTGEFLDSIGINVHLSFRDSPYGNLPLISKELAQLGVRHIRDGANLNPTGLNTRQAAAWTLLHAQGIRINAMLDPRYAVKAVTPQSLHALLSAGEGAVESVEGPNELDVSKIPDWPSVDREYQRSIWESRRMLGLSPHDVSLIGPSMAFANHGDQLGDISTISDFGNLHPYPGGQQPSVIFPHPGPQQDFFSRSMAQAAVMYNSLPIVVTESGWHDCFGERLKTPATPPEVIATYVPRLFLENFNYGIRRTYLYELIAWRNDPQQSNHEFHWGLLDYNGKEKPAYHALQTLISLVKPGADDSMPHAAATSPGASPIRYQLQAPSPTLHSTALTAPDGSLLLLVWQEVPGFDISSQRVLTVPPQTVQVLLDHTAASGVLYNISRGTNPLQRWTNPTNFELQVSDQVLILRITPRS